MRNSTVLILFSPVLAPCAASHKAAPGRLHDLQFGSAQNRVTATAVLGKRPDEILEALSKAAKSDPDPDTGVRLLAIEAFAHRGDSGRATIESQLSDPSPCIARAAQCARIGLDPQQQELSQPMCGRDLDALCEKP